MKTVLFTNSYVIKTQTSDRVPLKERVHRPFTPLSMGGVETPGPADSLTNRPQSRPHPSYLLRDVSRPGPLNQRSVVLHPSFPLHGPRRGTTVGTPVPSSPPYADPENFRTDRPEPFLQLVRQEGPEDPIHSSSYRTRRHTNRTTQRNKSVPVSLDHPTRFTKYETRETGPVCRRSFELETKRPESTRGDRGTPGRP